jgi:hypothetical protein
MNKPGKCYALVISTELGEDIKRFVEQDNLGHFNPVIQDSMQKQGVWDVLSRRKIVTFVF